uniref:Uncharacterized protein n=1 Tax=Anguilla anguilla TaxID=7936 RepID=A0A0E9WGX2_ANGAN
MLFCASLFKQTLCKQPSLSNDSLAMHACNICNLPFRKAPYTLHSITTKGNVLNYCCRT